jgi:hypothetical protein
MKHATKQNAGILRGATNNKVLNIPKYASYIRRLCHRTDSFISNLKMIFLSVELQYKMRQGGKHDGWVG